MSVYIIASSYQTAQKNAPHDFSKRPENVTALFLENQVELPYFKAFEQTPLKLDLLYDLLESHIQQILTQANLDIQALKNIPILLGSTAYTASDCEYQFSKQGVLNSEYSLALIGKYLEQRYQTQVFNFVTSCTSSAQAIRSAYQFIKNGFYENALVIGFEMFNRFTFEHFYSMNLLTQDSQYCPLIKSDGIVLGEGIGCVLLGNQPTSKLNCEMLGMYSVTDYDNLTNSSSHSLNCLLDGILRTANLNPEQINVIKVHGVGSPTDFIELDLLTQHFPKTPCLIAKHYFGHTLGASGAIETAFLVDCLQRDSIPKLNIQSAVKKFENLSFPEFDVSYYLNYFLGFGGSNLGWILKWKK